MPRQFRSRPAPWSSALAAIVGIGMLVLMLAIANRGCDSSDSNGVPRNSNAGPPPVALVFIGLWCAALIGVIGYHIANATKKGGVPTQLIDEYDDTARTHPDRPDTGERLRELDSLREQNLISAEEHAAKRREILSQI